MDPNSAQQPSRPKLQGGVSLDRVANIALILASAVVIGQFARSSSNKPQPHLYQAGDKLPALEGVSYTSAEHTLILYLSPRCTFCTDSLPLYRQVLNRRSPQHLGVIAIGRDAVSELAEYLLQHDVRVDAVVQVSAYQLRLRGTPTVLLVDKIGKIEHVWSGRLQSDREREFLGILFDES